MPDPSAPNPHRLPTTVVPSHYDLHLHPDLDAAAFRGHVAIDVEVLDVVDELVCNAADLEVDEAWLEVPGGVRRALEPHLDPAAERLSLVADGPIARGHGTVHVSFRGTLNDKLKGFYRSTYVADDGSERTLATTQFEATDARRAFPCWDEPDRKATFAVALTVADGLDAVSNAAEVSRDDHGDGTATIRFATTMVMSTYLVAFVVGELERTDPLDVRGTPLRVVHVPGRGDLTGFALEVASFALTFFEDWYGIDYPGDKLDLVAVPDFAFGAMENLGCVTFREVLLLIDPERATQAEAQNVVDVIAHELAHMWFGDLVTMRWWEGIWLNEAFATFMEVLATDAFRPAWQRWTSFGLSRAAAFEVDALEATRPIEYVVTSPEDAEGMFDLLTYEKGCSIVRMLQQYLGEEPFRAGIRRYLDAHRYANTDTGDLWDALEAATGEPVRRVADTWILQGGHPQVTASRHGTTVELRQHRALALGAPGDERWGVPVLWRAEVDGDVHEGRLLLDDAVATVELDAAPTWFLVNAGGHGFYRTAYDDDLRAALLAVVDRQLAPIERFVLVDDAWAAVLADELDVVDALDLVERVAVAEDDLSIWQRLLAVADDVDALVDDAHRPALQARVRAMLAPVAARLGDEVRPDDDDRRRQLRGSVLWARAVLGGDEEAVARARALDAAAQRDPAAIDAALAAAALRVVATTADAATHEQLHQRFVAADTPQDELRLLTALVLPRDETLLATVLPRTLTPEIRTQNAPYVLRQAMHHRTGGAMTWAFVRDRWDDLAERFPSNSIARMLEGIRSLDEPALADDVHRFLAEHPVPQGAKIVEQHLERLRANVALRARATPALHAALDAP